MDMVHNNGYVNKLVNDFLLRCTMPDNCSIKSYVECERGFSFSPCVPEPETWRRVPGRNPGSLLGCGTMAEMNQRCSALRDERGDEAEVTR